MSAARDDYLEYVLECECCKERWCLLCDMHWADCACSGPHDDDDEEEEDGLEE